APQPVHSMKACAIDQPTEPTDDAAARIVQRLQLASGILPGLGIEPQVRDAGTPLDQAELGIVELPDVAGGPAKLVKRKPQCRMPLGLETTLAKLCDRKTDRGENNHRAGENNRQNQRDAHGFQIFAVADEPAYRLARMPPVCRPPFPGCRSGRHTY